MPTITEITLQNFRGFEALLRLRLAPLTFLVGPNSSGKSSLSDAVLFMAQSGLLSLEATKPIWSGPLVDLGSFQDTVYRHDTERAIEIGARIKGLAFLRAVQPGLHQGESATVDVVAQMKAGEGSAEGRLARLGIAEERAESGSAEIHRGRAGSLTFRVRSGDISTKYVPQAWDSPADVLAAVLAKADARRLADLLEGRSLRDFAGSIQRVSSGRDRPRRFYERANSSSDDRARRLFDGIDPHGLESSRAGVRRALKKGLLALDIADEVSTTRLGDYHSAIKLQDNRTGVLSNLADFGYGASQVLPVLEGCASPGPGPLFIEQPEIHLHPRAQGHLAQILCDASRKRQIVIETHSEHMVNRARRLVAEGKLLARDVVIQYIERGPGGSHAVTIDLDEAGDFTRDWPEGFYDERYVETMKIAEAQAKRAAE